MRHVAIPMILTLSLCGVLAAEEAVPEPPKTGNHAVDRALASEEPLDRVSAVMSLHRGELYQRRKEVEERLRADPGVTAAVAAAADAEGRYRDAVKTDPGCSEVAKKLEAKQEAMNALNLERPDWKDRGAYKRYSDRRRKLAEEVQKLRNELADKAATSDALKPLRAASVAAADAALKIYADKLLADPDHRKITAELETFNATNAALSQELHRRRALRQEAERKKLEEARKKAAAERKKAEEAKKKAAAEKKKAEEAKKAAEAKAAAEKKADAPAP